ncbi:MAG TPA: hypothetical protein VLK84_17290, partial [Longimicrobium sp.]|nr:hypothetical protein [Longimicrobium sp.]
ARQELGADARALFALKQLWAGDPDPERTLDLHDKILEALDRGAVGYAEDERGGIGHFYRCPWGPVYVAREAVTLNSQRIRMGEQFILDVKGEEPGSFTRHLLVGTFERMRPLHNGPQFGARYVAPRWDLSAFERGETRPPPQAAPTRPPPQAAASRPQARCGLPRLRGINVWCLTHPAARQQLGADSRALSALKQLWAADPDPRRTLNLQRAISDALDRGAVGYAEDEGGGIGHFYRCPWGPVYVARKAVTLDSRRIRKGEQFILDVKGEESSSFTRQLLVGTFERIRPLYEGPQFGARYVAPRGDR